jgi:hypothetical protein
MASARHAACSISSAGSREGRLFPPGAPVIPNQLQTAARSLRVAGWCGFWTAGEGNSTVHCRRTPLAIVRTPSIFRCGQSYGRPPLRRA